MTGVRTVSYTHLAKKTGVDEVAAVNPEAAKKPAAKKAIDDALKAKEAAIDARPDLTDDEKKAAKDAAKDAADKAKEAIDAAPTDVAVDAAKETGTGDIAKVNSVAKEVAKKAVADELAKNCLLYTSFAFLDMVRQGLLTSEVASHQLGMTVAEFEALL